MPPTERPGTLEALLGQGLATHGARPAVTDATGTLDWTAFVARVGGYAGQLRGTGMRRGDRVALWLPNSADYLALIFACARLGLVAVHVNTRFRAGELGFLLRRSRARLLVTDFAFAAVDFPAVLAEVPAEDRAGLEAVIGRNAEAGQGVIPLREAVPVAAEASPDDPCLTFTTSGTTSGPKLVLHHQRAIAGHAHDVMRTIGTDAPDAALLGVTPFCGTFGNAAAMAMLAGGGHVVCTERFEAEAADAAIRRHRITHAVGGDDLLGRLAAAARSPHDSMRFFGFAAFHPGAAEAVAAAERAGLAPRGVYGSSEMQALFAVQPDDRRLLAGGVPVSAAARMAARDPASGAAVDGAGELCLDGPSRFSGYLDNPEADARATTADGIFRTGDLARLSGDGFLFETRLGDTLRLGGFLVNPEEIESFLQSLAGIEAAQVVGAGDGCVAFVRMQADAALDEAAVIAACRARLAHYKQPRRIVTIAEFPMTDSPNGRKIQRAKLRAMADALSPAPRPASPPAARRATGSPS
jgi:fatty-acyl-CoA synthase